MNRAGGSEFLDVIVFTQMSENTDPAKILKVITYLMYPEGSFDFRDKVRQFPFEFGIVGSRPHEIQEFLADQVTERLFNSKVFPDPPRGFALLDPNLMRFDHDFLSSPTFSANAACTAS